MSSGLGQKEKIIGTGLGKSTPKFAQLVIELQNRPPITKPYIYDIPLLLEPFTLGPLVVFCHAQKFPNRIPSRMCIKIPVQDRPGYTNDKVDIQIHVLQTL